MPKLIVEIDYGNRDHLYDYLDEHVEVIEAAIEDELDHNYDPPEPPPEITARKER